MIFSCGETQIFVAAAGYALPTGKYISGFILHPLFIIPFVTYLF